MTRISSQQIAQANLLAIQTQQSNMNTTMQQISSGLKYANPSDNPNDANRLFRLYQQQASLATYDYSVTLASSELEQEGSVLQSIANTLTSARETVVALNNPSLTVTDVNTHVIQLQTILNQLTDLANTRFEGRYIFSGSQNVAPIGKNVQGNYVYQGDEGYQNAIIGDNILIQMNDTAKDFFFQLPTNDLTLSGFAGQTAIVSANPGLVNPGVLTAANALIANEMQLNSIEIAAASASYDLSSTSDNIASALAITTAINKSYSLTDVVAYYNPNTLAFNGGGAYVDHIFVAGELVINGINIIGDTSLQAGATVVDRQTALINSFFVNNAVVASNNLGQLNLTSIDGTNLQITSTGASPGGLALAGFNFIAGDNKVQRANITLKSENPVDINTNTFVGTANAIGFSPGSYAVVNNTGTGVMSAPIMRDVDLNAGPKENYFIKFVTATTYNVYRASAPFTPVTGFDVYHLNQTYDLNATAINTLPATYTAGDSIVIDGVEVTITGVPALGDIFTIEKAPQAINDIFSALNNVINAAQNYKGQNTRYNYNMNIALTNIVNAQTSVTNVLGVVGARMQRIDFQSNVNSKYTELNQNEMSGIRDVDMAAAISQFSQAKIAFEAALQITAQTKGLSLFNYI